MKIRSFILPVAVVVLIGGYIVYKQISGNSDQAPATNNNQTSAPQETINPGTNNPQTTPPVTQSGYKDGQYTGQTASTVYGDVQVQVTISGGKITDVNFLTYPNHMGHTMEVSQMSMPMLRSEAIASQSANVNAVSGATQTSEGFSQSLASALSQAS